MRKSSFSNAMPLHLELSRELATLIMGHDSCLYSQWFEGNKNQLTDSLSCDHHLSDPDLLALLSSEIPEQMLMNFKLYPLLLKYVELTTRLVALYSTNFNKRRNSGAPGTHL